MSHQSKEEVDRLIADFNKHRTGNPLDKTAHDAILRILEVLSIKAAAIDRMADDIIEQASAMAIKTMVQEIAGLGITEFGMTVAQLQEASRKGPRR